MSLQNCKSATTLRSRKGAAILATVALVGLGGVQGAHADPAPEPDSIQLLSEFETYWQPMPFNTANDGTEARTASRGWVLDAGKAILEENDQTYLAINHAGAANETQAHRALIDDDSDWTETFPDALGPVLGGYFLDGIENGNLPLSTAMMTDLSVIPSSNPAKKYFNYPRPFLPDRSFGKPERLNGLASTLDTKRIPAWTDSLTGIAHEVGYADAESGLSQSFHSGHTAQAYANALRLAVILPELAPEIIARGAEMGNNRIVVGVHYPMDVMGGRIMGHANVAALMADEDYVQGTVLPAQKELAAYLTQRCQADGHGDTLALCIEDTGANDAGGYANGFTDLVSTKPVTDRASALEVYQERMTYGFEQVGTAGQEAVVPETAQALLITAFPNLTAEQRTAVLAATEIDSGYPLDSTSEGWERINLPAAISAKVTIDDKGAVVSVEPGQLVASAVDTSGADVVAQSQDQGQSGDAAVEPSASSSSSTGVVVVIVIVILAAGGALVWYFSKRQAGTATKE